MHTNPIIKEKRLYITKKSAQCISNHTVYSNSSVTEMLCLNSFTLPLNMSPFLQFTTLSLSSRLLRVAGFLVKTVHHLEAAAAEMLHRQIETSAGRSGGAYKSSFCVLYLFLTVTNGSGECRPGVNTHLQTTRVVVEDVQHSSKTLERGTQCSREKDQNNKLLAISADENGTQITLETIFSGVSFKNHGVIVTFPIKHKVVSCHTNINVL